MNGFKNTAPQDQSNESWLEAYNGNVTQLETQQAPANEVDDCHVEGTPLIPAGEYMLAYVEHFTQKAKGTGKITISFSVTKGDFSGAILPAYYRVKLTGPPGKFGPFSASKQGEYYEQMCDLIPELIGGRTDRISPQRLKGKTVLGEVVTVTTKWNGQQRKEHTQYSKVKRLIRLC